MIYQHPLAFLLGLEGIALLRAFAGEYDREFTLARIDEIRRLLDEADALGDGVEAHPITTRDGYAGWAPWYDEPGNQLIDLEQPAVQEIVAALPRGVALDAACGTGRHTAYLASLGHTTIGIDASPEMLAIARAKVPAAELHEGDLHRLPLADDSVDLVVCALALVHVPDLHAAYAELARVLRPGGQLVVSDSRGLIGDIGGPTIKATADGTLGYMPTWNRLTSEYITAALPLGRELRRCDELFRPDPIITEDGVDPHDGEPAPTHLPGRPPNRWALHAFVPAAANAANDGNPIAIVLHFQLRE